MLNIDDVSLPSDKSLKKLGDGVSDAPSDPLQRLDFVDVFVKIVGKSPYC